MSRMVRERAKLRQFNECLAEHGVKLDLENGIELFDALADFFQPEVIRSSDDRMAEAHEKMMEAIRILEGGQPVNIAREMKQSGLDPKNRSDYMRTRAFLEECGLLVHKKGEPEQWIKRITDATTKTAEATKSENAENAKKKDDVDAND